MDGEKAVVLFSGGQDSTTCLAWAKQEYDEVYALGFYYGQRHEIELEQAKYIASKEQLDVPLYFLSALPLQELGAAALTNKNIDPQVDATGSGNTYAETHGLPSTFVPGRNMLFLTLAAAYGAKLGVYNLVTGVCSADDAGYPDCRSQFVRGAEHALSSALDEQITIETPLLNRTKAETFMLARDLDALGVVLEHSHTCYRGERSTRHPWGYGCGECGACEERASGWNEFQTVLKGRVDA